MSEQKVMAENSSTKRRERGTGALIPPRIGVTRYWTGQIYDANGRAVRKSLRDAQGNKIEGSLKSGCDPKNPESWTNLTRARTALDLLRNDVKQGVIAVGSDPASIRYGDLRKLYLDNYRERGNRSLLTNAETGEDYVCGLKHLDNFFAYKSETEKGWKVSAITVESVKQFKVQRQQEGASNGTINRSLAALRRMFKIALQEKKLQPQHIPFIGMLEEPAQPRAGFLDITGYDKLQEVLPEYVRPLLQVGFYTGMRLGEIINLKWSRVDLSSNAIRLTPQDCKNKTGRYIPLIDGLPEMFENLRRKNPSADGNDFVFLSANGEPIGSFIKAWRNACIAAAIKTTINGEEIVSHFEKDGTYRGLIFHDLRRSAVRNLVQSGVDPTTAKAISGHRTDEVFQRYDIKVEDDLQNAGEKVAAHIRKQREAAAKAPKRLRVVAKQ